MRKKESGNLCDSKHSLLLFKEFICSLLANSLLKFTSIPLGKKGSKQTLKSMAGPYPNPSRDVSNSMNAGVTDDP